MIVYIHIADKARCWCFLKQQKTLANSSVDLQDPEDDQLPFCVPVGERWEFSDRKWRSSVKTICL